MANQKMLKKGINLIKQLDKIDELKIDELKIDELTMGDRINYINSGEEGHAD